MFRIALLLVLSVGAFECDAKRVRAGGVRLGSNPTAIIKINRCGMDPAIKGIGKLGPKYAGKIPFPDIAATFGGVDLNVKELRMVQFAEPKIDYVLSAPNKISGTIELPQVCVQGPFEASRRTVFKTQRDGGELTFNVSKAAVTFQAIIGEFENGVPMVANFECQSSLGPANLNVKKAKENFAIEVLQLAAKTFRPAFNTQVCAVAKKLINGQLNRLLSQVPNVLEVNKDCALKYQIVPTVAAESVQVALFAKVLTEEVSPFNPAPFVPIPEDKSMVVAKVSDALFNDLAYQLYLNKKLEFIVNSKSLPLLYSLIKLRCNPENEACLGNVAPALAEKYGADALVDAAFKAVSNPNIEFITDKATFNGTLNLALTVTPTNDTTKSYHEATATVAVSGGLQVRIKDSVLYARIVIENVNVKIDEEHNRKWEEKIKGTIKQVVEESINGGCLLKGLPLNKKVFGAGLEEPLIKFAAHTMQCQTAFAYEAKTSSEAQD